jgi:hypothetical protein
MSSLRLAADSFLPICGFCISITFRKHKMIYVKTKLILTCSVITLILLLELLRCFLLCSFQRTSKVLHIHITTITGSNMGCIPSKLSNVSIVNNQMCRPWIRKTYFSFSNLHRKEVIQPHLPIRLPCYDFTPITDLTFDGWFHCWLPHRLRVLSTFVV